MITLLISVPDALACGGFFCNNIPVDQSGEDILFVVDEQKDETTVHVQITYTGEADDFAWIVPVAGEPAIELSTDAAFRVLDSSTRPRLDMMLAAGMCLDLEEGMADDLAPPPPPPTAGGDVAVVSEGSVGPYDTVVLRASDSTELLDWLQAHGYDLPDGLDGALAPYVADGSHFVALRLSQGETTGALQPIALRYPGTGMSIPLQLTAIAATEHMPVRTYVLAEARAVPDSYLHVTLDTLGLAWWAPFSWRMDWASGQPYEDAVRLAVDEAGGHAFVTDFAGSSDFLQERLWSKQRFPVDQLASASNPYIFMNVLQQMGLQGEPLLLPMFQEFLPLPRELAQEGVTPTQFYNCLGCYASYVDAMPFDAEAFAARVDERIIRPRHDLQLAFDKHPWLTRMATALSPSEMTLDPTFAINRDLPQEVSMPPAFLAAMCEGEEQPAYGAADWETFPLRFGLPDGRFYGLPSAAYMGEHGTSPWELLSPLINRYALTVEDMGAQGQPVLLADYRQEAWAEADAWNASPPWEEVVIIDSPLPVVAEPADPPRACGCDSPTAARRELLAMLLVGVLSLRRRRA